MRLKIDATEPYIGMKTQIDVPDRGSKLKFWLSYTSYLFRGYIAYKKLVEFQRANGYGFGLFDTLTYRNSDLPLFGGLPCFSGHDITLFMKRLRTRLERKLGHRPVIDFILVCEYGDDKQRPHYHPIFFVYERISPYEFAKDVYETWSKGKTDSVDVYGRLQFDVVSKHVLNSFAAVRYILKYILKYVNVEEKFSEVLLKLQARYQVEEFEEVRRNYMYECRPFIRTSLNFGYTTQFDDPEELTISVPIDSEGNYETVRCPSYVYRKLFYDKKIEKYDAVGKPIYKRTEKGSYLYELNNIGKEYKGRHLESSINAAVALYKDLLSQLNTNESDIFFGFLGRRSLRDLAIYSLVYRHRLWSSGLSFDGHPFDTIQYTDFYLHCLDCVPTDPSELKFIIDSNSLLLFEYFDTLLDFLDQLCKYSHVKLSELPLSVESQMDNYNNLQFLLHYGN